MGPILVPRARRSPSLAIHLSKHVSVLVITGRGPPRMDTILVPRTRQTPPPHMGMLTMSNARRALFVLSTADNFVIRQMNVIDL